MRIEETDAPAGAFEGCDGMVVYGWAHDPSRPALRVGLDILADGRLVERIVADRPRPELAAAGHGDGQCGFFAVLPAALCDGRSHRIAVVETGSGRPLPGGPRDIAVPPAGLAATAALLDERRRLQHRLMVNSQELLNTGRVGQGNGCMAFDPALGEIYRSVLAGWPGIEPEEER
ncbi:hypothetical protein [Azospirillum largimobile]